MTDSDSSFHGKHLFSGHVLGKSFVADGDAGLERSWYNDLDDFIALPRITSLLLSYDGSSLIMEVSLLNEEKTQYISSIWLLDPAGKKPARRLTFSSEGEGSAVFTDDGDVLFISARPCPNVSYPHQPGSCGEATDVTAPEDAGSAEDLVNAIWRLPLSGGESYVVASRAGGFQQVYAAATSNRIFAVGDVFPGVSSEEENAQWFRQRRQSQESAIMHTSGQVRLLNHDLGPTVTHLFSGVLESNRQEEKITFCDITPGSDRWSPWQGVAISPDGSYVITDRVRECSQGNVASRLEYIDVDSKTLYPLIDYQENTIFAGPSISPNGKWLFFVRINLGTPQEGYQFSMHLVRLTGHPVDALVNECDIFTIASRWDRDIKGCVWSPDSSGLFCIADDNGRGPIFRLNLFASGDQIHDSQSSPEAEVTSQAQQIPDIDAIPEKITHDDCCYTDLNVDPSGRYIYALRSSFLQPPHPVRIEVVSGKFTPIPSVIAPIRMPGRIEDVSVKAVDGVSVRGWLVLPHRSDPAPLIVAIHGGPQASWSSWSWNYNPWLFAAQGYAVLLPDPALSTGYGREFIQRGLDSWGKAPYTDIMAITDAIVARGDIDETKTAVIGGSFGGYMANWIAGHTNRFTAIVSHAGLWALNQFHRTTDWVGYCFISFSPDGMKEYSPHHFVHNIATPMLVIHGDKDYRVPIGEALRLWHDLLTESQLPMGSDGQTPHRFLYFPDETHWIGKPPNIKAWYREILAFLDKHTLGTAKEQTPEEKLES